MPPSPIRPSRRHVAELIALAVIVALMVLKPF